jgi:hypothetical protein
MYDQTAKRRGMHESIGASRPLVSPPEEPATASADLDEVLVADLRGGMTPSQVVGQKLGVLLREAGEAGRAEDARYVLGRNSLR